MTRLKDKKTLKHNTCTYRTSPFPFILLFIVHNVCRDKLKNNTPSWDCGIDRALLDNTANRFFTKFFRTSNIRKCGITWVSENIPLRIIYSVIVKKRRGNIGNICANEHVGTPAFFKHYLYS